MKRIGLADLEPDMVLAQDISRPDGALLARNGATLNPGMISLIQRMAEIETVNIQGSGFAGPEERRAWQKEQLKALIHRFSKAGKDPVMIRLRKLETDRIMNEE